MKKLDIIITHHLNKNDYLLEMGLKSIREQDAELDIGTWVVSDAKETPKVMSLDNFKWELCLDPKFSTASAKVNHAMNYLIRKDADYVLWMSDDVFLTKSCVRRMVETCMDPDNLIVNPASNSDQPVQYIIRHKLGGVDIFRLSEIARPEDCELQVLFNYQTDIQLTWAMHRMSFFCTMMQPKTFFKIGPLDEKLDSRHNDDDYCIRAKREKIYPVMNIEAFAWHWGSKTINESYTKADRNAATEYFGKKHGIKVEMPHDPP